MYHYRKEKRTTFAKEMIKLFGFVKYVIKKI